MTTHVLIFVVQAGNIADQECDRDVNSKDFEMFKEIFYTASDKCYPGARRTISMELISVPSLSIQIMDQLRNIHYSSKPGEIVLHFYEIIRFFYEHTQLT